MIYDKSRMAESNPCRNYKTIGVSVIKHVLFQIHEGDGLSDRVCTTCVENLSTAYLFKLQCERTNTLLHKYPGRYLKYF